MALITPPPGTILGSTTYPHRLYHTGVSEVQYAHPDGDDGNDGLSWGTAKQTILAAWDDLPSTGGTIYIADNTDIGGEVANQGLWIAGNGSPTDFASPPAGWRAEKSGVTNLIGIPATGYRHSTVAAINGGSGTDRAKPTIWLNGTDGVNFRHLQVRYPAVGIRIGVDSTQTNRNVSTSNIVFDNIIVLLNGAAGNGPGVDMGYCFWVYFINSHLSGCITQYNLTAATASAGVGTYTTSINHHFVAGDFVFVSDVTPSAYNGGWEITNIPAANQFRVALGSTPASGSVFGHVHPLRTDRAPALLMDARAASGGSNAGSFIGYNTTIDGTGIRYRIGGNSVWSFEWHECGQESDFVHPIGPAVEIMDADEYGFATVSSMARIDAGTANGAEGKTLQVNEDAPQGVVTAWTVNDISGPVTVLGNLYRPGVQPESISKSGGMGFQRGRLIAQVDQTNRAFPARTVVRPNLATDDASLWSALSGSATVATGKIAPDGTTLAGQLTSSSGNQWKRVHSASITVAVGDFFFVGGWFRSTVTDYTPAHPFTIGVGTATLENGTSGATIQYHDTGDEWQWCYGLHEITAGAGSVTVDMYMVATNGWPAEFYAPTLMHFPIADYSEAEIRDFAWSMGATPKDTPQGAVTTMRDQKLIAMGGLGVGNSTTDTVLGSVSGRIEVFDAEGSSLGFVPYYAGEFSPDDVAGLRHWYDFSDISTLFTDTARSVAVTADGNVIGSVTDKAGTLHLIRGGGSGTEPLYKTAIFNGQSVARFDGTDDWLKHTSATSPADSSFTNFVVAQKRSGISANYDTLVGFFHASANLLTQNSGSGTAYSWYLNQAAAINALAGTATSRTVIVARINSAASLDAYFDGGTATNINPNDNVTVGGTLALGAVNDGSSAGDYDIAEFIVYDSALVAANINEVGQYLADKYGTTWTTVT